MKIHRALLKDGVPFSKSEEVVFKDVNFDQNHVKSIPHCVVNMTATEFEGILRVELEINALVIAVCSYSLEDTELKFKINEELNFTDDPNDENSLYESGNEIDVDPYILEFILGRVPLKVVKKGAKRPKNGDGYRVLTEDEYLEEEKNKTDPRWDALDNVKIK